MNFNKLIHFMICRRKLP